MSGYMVAAALTFLALAWGSWFLVAVVSAMPTEYRCPPGCRCRGRLTLGDLRDQDPADWGRDFPRT